MLEHGGRLRAAAQQWGIPLASWLDLSTGIAPWSLPMPEVPASVWQRLPEVEDGLAPLAASHYGAPLALPLAGSQAAIQGLPQLRSRSRVGVLSPTYAEHAEAWRQAGHHLVALDEAAVDAQLPSLDVLVVVNPNNPTGRLLAPERLLQWHADLALRGGWLVVDEAFMDCTPQHSLAAYSARPGLLILRSFGKFFGMAGVRLGFLLAASEVLQRLDALLGPWTVAGPSRYLALAQLRDAEGQRRQRLALQQASGRLADLLRSSGLPPAGGSGLFQWVVTEEAAAVHGFLAERGILLRYFAAPVTGLRFGLPADEPAWGRLQQALRQYRGLAS